MNLHNLEVERRSLVDSLKTNESIAEGSPDVSEKRFQAAFSDYASAPVDSVMTLNIDPGSQGFLLWFYVSAYFPLVAACLGPLANSFSILALIEDWRMVKDTGELVNDPGYLRAINAISLALALVGNLSLLMNFSKGSTYLITQKVSIACWIIACGLLLVVVIQINKFCIHEGHYRRSEAFWLGVNTTFFYFSCTVFLSINYSGYMLEKYPPTFNLNSSQRTLMVYTICLSAWLVIGSLINQKLVEGIRLGAALYFCTTSILTIGLGDITPKTVGAKIFILIYSLVGVLIMGLIIAMITRVAILSSDQVIRWHKLEKGRVKKIKHCRDKGRGFSSEESFIAARNLRHRVDNLQTAISIATTLIVFVIYVFVGTTAFFISEGWNYFDAFYFCFLCLITIGYGDFHPVSPFGRMFFVAWTIFAIPLMTVLISDLGEQLFKIALKMNSATQNLFVGSNSGDGESEMGNIFKEELALDKGIDKVSDALKKSGIPYKSMPLPQMVQYHTELLHNAIESLNSACEKDVKLDIDLADAVKNLILSEIANIEKLQRLAMLFNQMTKYFIDTLDEEPKFYDHEEWLSFTRLLYDLPDDASESSVLEEMTNPANMYWLGDNSPLKVPLIEPRYFYFRSMFKFENDLMNISDSSYNSLKALDKEYHAMQAEKK